MIQKKNMLKSWLYAPSWVFPQLSGVKLGETKEPQALGKWVPGDLYIPRWAPRRVIFNIHYEVFVHFCERKVNKMLRKKEYEAPRLDHQGSRDGPSRPQNLLIYTFFMILTSFRPSSSIGILDACTCPPCALASRVSVVIPGPSMEDRDTFATHRCLHQTHRSLNTF